MLPPFWTQVMPPPCPGFTQNWFPIAHDPSGSFPNTVWQVTGEVLIFAGGKLISVLVVAACVLGHLGSLQQLPLEYEVIMDMTESIFPPSSHPEPSPDSCQSFVLVTVV